MLMNNFIWSNSVCVVVTFFLALLDFWSLTSPINWATSAKSARYSGLFKIEETATPESFPSSIFKILSIYNLYNWSTLGKIEANFAFNSLLRTVGSASFKSFSISVLSLIIVSEDLLMLSGSLLKCDNPTLLTLRATFCTSRDTSFSSFTPIRSLSYRPSIASWSFANVQNAVPLSATENKMVIEKPTINFVLRLNFSIDLSADTLNFPSKYERWVKFGFRNSNAILTVRHYLTTVCQFVRC